LRLRFNNSFKNSSSPSKDEQPQEATGTTIKQFKNLTNPLSKLGKYVQQVKSPIAEGIAIVDARVIAFQTNQKK
jgi:hypothetical protein